MAKIIIVDDDSLVGDLTTFLLKGAGYETELVSESVKAIPIIKAQRPSLVILDILMPGIDGLTLCRQIKSDPDLKDMKVVIVSGKSFKDDKDRAISFGADAFIEKPYKVDSFAEQIKAVMASAEVRQITAPPSAPVGELKARVWGCRAAMPAPIASSRYGRKTSCVALEFKDNLLVFDAGSGLGELGAAMDGNRDKTWLFLSHFHPDHVEGLDTFACARPKGHTIYITGANDPAKSLQDAVNELFAKSTTPLAAEVQLYEALEDSYEIMPGVKLSAFYLNHPTTTLGYKLETLGKTFVYCPVGEIYGEDATALQDYDQKLGGICAGADLLIHNAQYNEADYAANKNTGHSSFANAVHFAGRHQIKQLVLFHYAGNYSDEIIDQMAESAGKIIADSGYALKCVAATEGLVLPF